MTATLPDTDTEPTQQQLLADELRGVLSARKAADTAADLIDKGWRNIDFSDLLFMTDIARAVGVSLPSTHRWREKHRDEIPEPAVRIKMPRGELLGWTRLDALTVIRTYIADRNRGRTPASPAIFTPSRKRSS